MGGRSAARRAAEEAARVRQEEEARQERIRQGTQNINQTFDGQFTDAFYDDIAKSYLDFANPQLERQHSQANQQHMYDLARTGKLDSSTRATRGAALQENYDLGQQQIADAALNHQNQTRGAVEDARANLIGQLNVTGDAQGAMNAAQTRMAALSQPALGADPIVNLFSDFTGALGQRYAHERAYAASGGASHASNPIAVGARPGAVTVRG